MADLQELQGQIQMAAMLISIGLTTAERIKEHFSKQGVDDETLAVIMAEVDRRLARRG